MPSTSTLAHRSWLAALLLAALTPACGETVAEMDGPDAATTDTTAPSISSTEPAADATGVAADAKIFVTFSEPMDRASVEAAYASTDLPDTAVAFEWSPDRTVLTITPTAPLEYAEGTGTDPATVTARSYAIQLGTGALDLAGNPLAAPLELSFSTRKRLTASLALHLPLTATYRNSSNDGSANGMRAGDNGADNTYRAYLTFDLSPLPGDLEVEAAQFSARQLPPDGAPYNLGPVMTHHLTFATLNNVGAVQALSLPGVFSADGTVETKSIDVTSQVGDDIANRVERGDRSQYRLQIDQATNSNGVVDRATFDTATFAMTVVYVAE